MVSIDDVNDTFSDPEDEALPPPPPAASKSSTSTSTSSAPPLSNVPRHKLWTTLYPLYIDSKQPHKSGGRRVSSKHALNWPMAEPMARGCLSLRLETVFEQNKTHPKDWANPGRVKVLLRREDGSYPHPTIRSKNDLLLALCTMLKPFQPSTPSAPTTLSSTSTKSEIPLPLPSIEKRYPPNSPAVSFGQYDQAANGKGPPGMFPGGGPPKVEEVVEKPLVKVMPKQKKIHVKRR